MSGLFQGRLALKWDIELFPEHYLAFFRVVGRKSVSVKVRIPFNAWVSLGLAGLLLQVPRREVIAMERKGLFQTLRIPSGETGERGHEEPRGPHRLYRIESVLKHASYSGNPLTVPDPDVEGVHLY